MSSKKQIIWCFILCLYIITIDAQKKLDHRKVVYALNCGSYSPYTSSAGFRYQGDTYFEQGTRIADYQIQPKYANQDIKYTSDDIIYKSERISDDSFAYYLPIDQPGTYVLIFQFVELTIDRTGARLFNIKFGDKKIVDSLDIYHKVGRFTAYEEYIEFELKDDEIFYQENVCSNAYKFKDKTLVLEFEKTDQGLPKVNGIILFKGTLRQTNYQDLTEERKVEIERAKQAELDRRIGVKVTAKSDDEIEKIYQSVEKENYSLLKLLFQGPGLIVSLTILLLILIVLNMETNSFILRTKVKDGAIKTE